MVVCIIVMVKHVTKFSVLVSGWLDIFCSLTHTLGSAWLSWPSIDFSSRLVWRWVRCQGAFNVGHQLCLTLICLRCSGESLLNLSQVTFQCLHSLQHNPLYVPMRESNVWVGSCPLGAASSHADSNVRVREQNMPNHPDTRTQNLVTCLTVTFANTNETLSWAQITSMDELSLFIHTTEVMPQASHKTVTVINWIL